jgi:hypothetical protein
VPGGGGPQLTVGGVMPWPGAGVSVTAAPAPAGARAVTIPTPQAPPVTTACSPGESNAIDHCGGGRREANGVVMAGTVRVS